MFRPAFILIVVLTIALIPLSAQESGGLREFTAKSGKTVLAELLTISPDQRMAKIRRDDGNEFDLEIVALCLDDQQYLKNWLESRPLRIEADVPIVSPADFHLKVGINKKSLNSNRYRQGESTFEEKKFQYVVRVQNISRKTLTGARLQYSILWKDPLQIFKNVSGKWDYEYTPKGPGTRGRVVGEIELTPLAFNREEEVATDSFDLNRATIFKEYSREDALIGIIFRIVADDGAVLLEDRVGTSRIDEISWVEATTSPIGMLD